MGNNGKIKESIFRNKNEPASNELKHLSVKLFELTIILTFF